MTELERTIKQILSDKRRKADQKRTHRETEQAADQITRQYNEEFDSIYGRIEAIKQTETEFVKWANKCKIDDAWKEVVDGAGFYKHLLDNARSAYKRFREEGYEPETAFDKGTADLTDWIEGSNSEGGGGTIYLNHSPQFLHRMRHLLE